MIDLKKVKYTSLNSREKENYNFHKVASALADYGYDSMRLNNDWQGADFIAVKGDEIIKVQLKGRFTVDKKYIGKDIYVVFLEDNIVRLYNHDKAVSVLNDGVLNSTSWDEKGAYSWGKTPKEYNCIINNI